MCECFNIIICMLSDNGYPVNRRDMTAEINRRLNFAQRSPIGLTEAVEYFFLFCNLRTEDFVGRPTTLYPFLPLSTNVLYSIFIILIVDQAYLRTSPTPSFR